MPALAEQLEALIRRMVREEWRAIRDEMNENAEEPGECLLTITAASKRAAVGRSTLYRWIADGLPVREAPGSVEGKAITRIRQADLDAWISHLPTRGGIPARKGPPSLDELVAERRGKQAPRRRGKRRAV